MKRIYLISLALMALLFSLKTMAVPAQPGVIEFEQPNGYILNITLHGDEFVHWSQTTDSYTVLQNEEGYYVYAIQNDKSELTLSNVVAHNPADRLFDEKAFLNDLSKSLRFNKSQINEAFTSWGGRKSLSKRGGFPTTGTNNMVMILANFNDTEPTFPQSDFDDYMNQSDYNGYGSFKDYYMEVSYGQLIVNTTVTVWVTLPNSHDFYGPDSRWSQFARDAVEAADPHVDFSQFDNDSDGMVDGVAIIHQGSGQEITGNTNDIWSHSSSISYYGITLDGVDIGPYTTQPEKRSGSMATIGVMCHEFGHNLGAPDYYDTDYEDNGSYTGTGDWDVMAGGSHMLSGKMPPHHNPYTKWKYYGWITPTLLNSQQTVTMENSVENSAEFYYYMTTSSDEFWLLENRQQIGFDSYVPGHGLVIYHADESHINAYDSPNSINAGSHQGFYPVCAFASGNPPTTYGNINSASTPFPGMLNTTEFTDMTTPSSTSWAGSYTGKPITSIAETGATITFDFMADVYFATFTITDSETSSALENATVTVGNQTAYTNANGQAVLTLQDGAYEYTVSKYAFYDSVGSITVSGGNISENLSLNPAPIQYTLSFKVKSDFDGSLIEGAEIVVDGNTINSDANGDASVDLIEGSYTYVINMNGFEEYTASVNISNSDLLRNIYMVPLLHSVSFTVSKDGALAEGASISVGGSNLTTDANGSAIIDLPDGDHTYTVTCEGCSIYEDVLTVNGMEEEIIVTMVGASEVIFSSLSIYPNPVSDILNVDFEGNYRVTVYNAIGKVVENKMGNGITQVNVNGLSKGIYFMKISKNGNESIHKFIVNR